jgi:hypothetical protein
MRRIAYQKFGLWCGYSSVALLGARVGLIVHRCEALKVEMGINLCGADIGVSKKFLDGAQVTAGFEHMTGEGVPEHMRMQMLE